MAKTFRISCVGFCFILLLFQAASSDDLRRNPFQATSDGSYGVWHLDWPWLANASTSFRVDGKDYSTEDNTLKLLDVKKTEGQDKLGRYAKVSFDYAAGDVNVTTSYREYRRAFFDVMFDGFFVVFSQEFPQGAKGVSVNDKHGIVSQYPSFHIDRHVEGEPKRADLGVMAFGDLFSGYVQLDIQQISANMTQLPGGLFSGPIVLFDKLDNAAIISAFNHFTANSYVHDPKQGTVAWGIMGNVDEIPPGYTMETVVYYNDRFHNRGINQAMEEWGYLLRTQYGRTSAAMETDVTNNYLGYYTDNGAYYYHQTEPNSTYETTLLKVFNDSIAKDIPYGYMQYDDYWYPVETSHTGYGATTKWEALPSVFPHGLEYMYEKMKLPVIAHNRFWSYKTPYAKQNGGKWDFLLDPTSGMGLPLEEEFWNWLFANSKPWGLVNYEQDWMNTQMEQIAALNSNISLAEQWLKQMGSAAERNSMNLQFCMTLPRQIMAALEIPALSQARASDDYADSRQWRIGITSIFLHALRIAPFKDNFWTTSKQPGNPYSGGNKTEVNPVREAVIALLSTGPVGASDKLGLTNTSIVKRLCRKDGLLLKPGIPARAIDEQIKQRAFGGDSLYSPKGEVYESVYAIGGVYFGITIASALEAPYRRARWLPGRYAPYNKVETFWYKMDDNSSNPTDLRHSSMVFDDCANDSFCVIYRSPGYNITNETGDRATFVLMGELDKYVPISPQRISNIKVQSDDVIMWLKGVQEEHVTMYYYMDGRNVTGIECVFGGDGTAVVSFGRHACYAQ